MAQAVNGELTRLWLPARAPLQADQQPAVVEQPRGVVRRIERRPRLARDDAEVLLARVYGRCAGRGGVRSRDRRWGTLQA